MLVHIESLPPASRVWIYQANQRLNAEAKNYLETKISAFLENWETHGAPLKASWKLYHDYFLVIAVDDSFNQPSGCSIDKSVKFLREVENELGIGFLEKTKVAILEEDKISTFELKDVKKFVQQGIITPQTIVFNNLVPTLAELEQIWQIPASKTWLSRYFS
jgi:hypothetical protein